MKRLSAIAFALTALASGAVAQSIVVVDKDGNQHKFCTDYVQDVTFEVVDNRPNYVFSQLTVNNYGSGNAGLVFKTADGITAGFDLYMAEPSAILRDGTYTLGAAEGNRIDISDSNYTYFSPDGTAKQAFKSGTMTISHNSEAVYTISFEAVLADGSGVRGSYEGKLNAMSPVVDVRLTTIKQIDINDPKAGEFYLRLSDASYNYEAVFDLFCGADAKAVADGTYTLAETNASMTYSSKTGIDIYSPYVQLKITSPIEVRTEAGVTTMTTTAVNDDVTYNITVEGAIEYLAPKTPEGVKYDMELLKWDTSNIALTFTSDGQPEIKLDVYYSPKAEFFYGGVYNLATSGTQYINPSSVRYTYVDNKAISAGSMVVEHNGNDYTVTFEFTYDGDKTIKGYYQGVPNDFLPVKDVVITDVKAADNDDLQNGEFYLKFNNSNWDYEGVFDLFCESGATTIPDGTYNLGADGAPMTYSAKSQVQAYPVDSNIYKFVKPIVIGTEDGKRTITTSIVTDKGLTFNFSFKGDITYVTK